MQRRLLLCLALSACVIVTDSACRRTDTASSDRRTATWLDISPALGDPPQDPGDALALLQAFGSTTLRVRGVSVTFGIVPLVRGYPAAQELVQRVDSGLRRAWRGASAAEERGAPTEATELLAEALEKEPLTIVATGSVTTIASVLLRHPQSASRIDRVIVIAGRSLDGPASPPSGGGQADGNADIDPASMQVLLDSPVALTLVRPGPGSGAVLDTADLERLDAGHGPIKLITPSARAWLQAVTGRDGATAFPVPAMLAVDAAAHPGQVRCEPAVASLSPAGGAGRHVQVTNGTAGRRVNWCHTADAGARTRMVDDVLRVRPVAR